jgi:hypothetical protein
MQIESFFSRRKWACCKKVKEDGVMVSPLDLAHHKPYECLLLGYLPCQPPLGADNKDVHGGTADLKHEKPPDKFVIISVPGDHSRKPPLGCIRNLEVFTLSLSIVVLILFVTISQS